MKFFTTFFLIFLACIPASAQGEGLILASGNGIALTSRDIDPKIGAAIENLEKGVAQSRSMLLDEEIGKILLADEARARRISIAGLLNLEVAKKVPNPTAAQIREVYEENRAQIGEATFEQVKPRIIAFLRRAPEEKVLDEFLAKLKAKYKVSMPADVNSPNIKPADALAIVNGKTIAARPFLESIKPALYDFQYGIYEGAMKEIEESLYSKLVFAESASLKMPSEEYLAKEISDKMKDFSEDERIGLQLALRDRLYEKYGIKILLKEPEAPIQNISADDDPSTGDPRAPVTVVMFTDFECPACRATHPVLKEVLAEFSGKARLVVRDFPLVSIHPDAFKAAQAANAAKAQGKFFEFAELLYRATKFDLPAIKKMAQQAKLNQAKFLADLASPKNIAEIKKDIADGEAYGISATPAIFINGKVVRKLSADSFRQAIQNALNIK